MILYSWNVNGLRAAAQKGFWDWFASRPADLVGLQETKLQPGMEVGFPGPDGYQSLWCHSVKRKGYSGVAVFYQSPPLGSALELPLTEFQGEGRLIHLEYPEFHYFNIYFPNGQMSQERLAHKLGYYDAFLQLAQKLRQDKPVVVCGDFNTAHKEIDLKNPKQNENTSGFLPIERAWLDKFVAAGYIDTFRLFNSEGGNYSWWSYRYGSRGRNAGWRIDYFFVSQELKSKVKRAWIESDVEGSDHCPVGLELVF